MEAESLDRQRCHRDILNTPYLLFGKFSISFAFFCKFFNWLNMLNVIIGNIEPHLNIKLVAVVAAFVVVAIQI